MLRPRSLAPVAVLCVTLGLGVGLAVEATLAARSAWPFAAKPAEAAASSPAVSQTTPPSSPEAAASAAGLDEEHWNELTRSLATMAAGYRGRVGIYIRDIKNDRTWTYHADDLFPSASLIKVPIMASVFEKIKEGDIHLGTRLVLRRRDRVGGSGSLKWRPDGSKFTVRELLEHMMAESDNTATRIMIEQVGMGFLQEQFAKMGLVYTKIHPSGMSLVGGAVRQENYTTAREMAMLLEKIHNRELVDKPSSELMDDLMRHQRVRRRLAQYVPVGWEIAHKTGLLRRACHDCAIVSSPEGEIVIAVLTGQNRDYKRAKAFIAKIGRTIYNRYGDDEPVVRNTRRRSSSRAS